MKCNICGESMAMEDFADHMNEHRIERILKERETPWCIPTPTENFQVEQIYPGRVIIPVDAKIQEIKERWERLKRLLEEVKSREYDFEDVFQSEMEPLGPHSLGYDVANFVLGNPPEKPPLTMADLRRNCFPKEYQWYQEQPESIEVEEHPARDWRGRLESIKEQLKGEK
jgi:hypothetical protein